jgi:enoyl-CoA hydratase
MSDCPHLKAEKIGRLGRLTLTRPEALNALTPEMIGAMHHAFDLWDADDEIDVILLRGEGRAFCAGGDIKRIWQLVSQGGEDYAAFYAEEYRLDWRIHTSVKPVVSFLGGTVMGGGAGLSMLGSHPVACETTLFAMPETAIGFFPDVGATWFLGRCPGVLGRYLGMTGARIAAADLLACKLVRHVIPAARFPEVEKALAGGCPREGGIAAVECLLDSYHELAGPSPLARDYAAIERAFGQPDVEAIIAALAVEEGDWAETARQALAAAAPTSLKLAYRQSQIGARLPLDRALAVEYRLSTRIAAAPDFAEGVRARLIDRDGKPQWSPARVEDVSDAAINALFGPLGEGRELVLA